MHLKLMSERSGAIDHCPIIPPSLTDCLLPGAEYCGAGWQFGELLIQEWNCEPRMRYSTYLFYADDAIRIMEDENLPMLYFILRNNFYGHWAALGPHVDPQWTCNILSIPVYDYTLNGHSGSVYSKVEFFYSTTQLSEAAVHFPLLQLLLRLKEQGLPALFHPINHAVAVEVLARIGEILQTSCQGSIRRLYAGVKNMQLLLDTLHTLSTLPKFHPL